VSSSLASWVRVWRRLVARWRAGLGEVTGSAPGMWSVRWDPGYGRVGEGGVGGRGERVFGEGWGVRGAPPFVVRWRWRWALG
jgi:hypothetical protein